MTTNPVVAGILLIGISWGFYEGLKPKTPVQPKPIVKECPVITDIITTLANNAVQYSVVLNNGRRYVISSSDKIAIGQKMCGNIND